MPLLQVSPRTAVQSESGVIYSAAPARFRGHVLFDNGAHIRMLPPSVWRDIKKGLVTQAALPPRPAGAASPV